MQFNRDQIFSLSRRIVQVDIPEFDWTAFIRPLSLAAAFEVREDFNTDGRDESVAMLRIFVRSVCDDAGNLLFTDQDIPELKNLPMSLVTTIFNRASEVSGLGVKSIEDEAKN